MQKPKSKSCKICYGFGLWAMGDPTPMGEMDARGGMPTIECPACGANKNPSKLLAEKTGLKRVKKDRNKS